ncbi:hypothetical protein DAPPUDRAFT_304726 [Daphnia pulex]|uniref:Uncharacterized protein n=1 Tax=Daphnia pulex TaxID=6669 RepID=E9FW42_DAPPU|nr:hypothetical protein DAPPUDRAFT_304726 [Daphnia pulex]|eukprot:EFX88656.1 hypothetical protein DAPPUDRAFT_304726 [Daphnia pulex]
MAMMTCFFFIDLHVNCCRPRWWKNVPRLFARISSTFPLMLFVFISFTLHDLTFFFNTKIIIMRTSLDAHNNANPSKRHRVTVVSRPAVVCNKSRKSSVISITPKLRVFLTNNEICFLFPSSRDGFSDNRNHPLCFFSFSPIILLVSRRITTRK